MEGAVGLGGDAGRERPAVGHAVGMGKERAGTARVKAAREWRGYALQKRRRGSSAYSSSSRSSFSSAMAMVSARGREREVEHEGERREGRGSEGE